MLGSFPDVLSDPPECFVQHIGGVTGVRQLHRMLLLPSCPRVTQVINIAGRLHRETSQSIPEGSRLRGNTASG